MGKFGSKNKVSTNITDYSLMLLGEPGIGKTTVMYETCYKLVGDDYLFLDSGKEDGVKSINGLNSEPVNTWSKFDEVTKDLVKNRNTYTEKIIVIDTIDEIFSMAEPEVVRRYNQEKMGEKNFKPVKSINSAYGGFGNGLTQVENLVLEKIWSLKEAGYTVWMCGHVKTKEVIDPVSDQTYNTLSALLSQRYFNCIKTKMDVVGMAIIDRTIATESTGRKNIATREEITRNKVKSESRKIIFRDDNYGVDSKSRLRYIVDEIPLDSDALIDALQDAVNKAANTEKPVYKGTMFSKSETKVAPKKVEMVEESFDSEPTVATDVPTSDEDDLFDVGAIAEEAEEIDIEELRTKAKNAIKSADAASKAEAKKVVQAYGKIADVDFEGLNKILEICGQ